jgi:protein-S-isoprenylcysteine O-methyltransferase Ste14
MRVANTSYRSYCTYMSFFIRVGIPIAIAIVVLFTAILPLVRSRLLYGRWGFVVFEETNPVQRVVGAALAFLFALIAGLGAVCAALGPGALGAWTPPASVAYAGCALLLFALPLIALAQHEMAESWRIGIDEERTELVTRGLFRVVRNPIFSGLMAAVLGLVLLLPCAWTVMTAAMILVVVAIQTRLEEQHLLAIHGESYRRYAESVGRFFPGVGLGVGPSRRVTRRARV